MAGTSVNVDSEDLEADDLVTAAMALASGLPNAAATDPETPTNNILYTLDTSAASVQLSGVRTGFGRVRQNKRDIYVTAKDLSDATLNKSDLSDIVRDSVESSNGKESVRSFDHDGKTGCVINGVAEAKEIHNPAGQLPNEMSDQQSVMTRTEQTQNGPEQQNKDEAESGLLKATDFNSLPNNYDGDSTNTDSEFQVLHTKRRRSDAFIESGSSIPTSTSYGSEGSLSDIKCQYRQERFNPFDKDLAIEEDYFVDDPVSDTMRRPTSDSNASSTWTDVSHPASVNSDEITYADLGLAEDHFCQPDGHFGLSGTEEMEMAIGTCKEMILEAPPHSDKQKNLVRKLVQLRLKLQELKEGPEPIPQHVKMVVGHKFHLRTSKSSKHYCEKCNGVIWGILQTWYKCTECGYCSHEKCLNLITRTCASVKVKEDPTYYLSICPDRGLSSQSYRCAECRGQISFKSGYSEPRLCDYSGSYYCELCHWNDTMIIPARVLHNWDFGLYKVCRASKQFLKLMSNKAVIRVLDINPMLFNYVEELNEIKKMREELLIMKKYILLCTFAMKSKVLLHLKNRQHFVESSDIYSMKDLWDVQADTLLPELAQVHSSWAQHIKTDCQLCQARGFTCELCDIQEVLFPFDNIAIVCSQCSYVMHRHCFAQKGNRCPRCDQRNQKMSK